MEKIVKNLEELKEINKTFELSNDEVEKILNDVQKAKVCVPVIGKFSTGKSALINAVLGYSRGILKEDIEPQTAVPAEIIWDGEEEFVEVYNNDNSIDRMDISDYRELEVDANSVKNSRIHLNNSFLREIPDVMIVDMPGFDSDYEIHNKAIDNYLPQSLAYVIAFAADELISTSSYSIGDTLRELCLHDMPLCAVVTKKDKVLSEDDYNSAFIQLKENLRKYVGEREITYCVTSSRNGEVEEFEKFLQNIQRDSRRILSDKYQKLVDSILETTDSYLKSTLKNIELSESDLEEKKEKLIKEMQVLESKLATEKRELEIQLKMAVDHIVYDVQSALKNALEDLVRQIMANRDVKERLNSLMRETITISIKKHVIPRINRYLEKVDNCVNGDELSNININCNLFVDNFEVNIINEIVKNSILYMIAGPLVSSIMIIFKNIKREKERRKQMEMIRQELLNNVFPNIETQVRMGVEEAIAKQIEIINTEVDNGVNQQRDVIMKSLKDVKSELYEEQEYKQAMLIKLKASLERIGEIRNGI